MLAALPGEFEPYLLIARRLVLGERGYVASSRVVEPSEMETLVSDGVWDYFIVSRRLSPGLMRRLPDVDGSTFAVNGAINLQIGRRSRLGVEPASLGLVGKVATAEGEVREHREYTRIYEAASRYLRRSERS